MNAYDLLEAMDAIDDDILERSELQRKSPMRFVKPGLIAACCVLVLSLMYAQLRYGIWHPPSVGVDPTTTQEPADHTHPTDPPVILTPESRYVAGELIIQFGDLEYIPENGNNYVDIQFSDEQLRMSVVSTNKIGKEYTYANIRTVTWSRELLVKHIEAMRGLYPSYPETVDVEAMVPQCEEVTIRMYGSDGQTEAFSIYCFDGVPGWFEETEGQWRIFSLCAMPEPTYLTLDDVRALAKLEEQITWEHLAGFTATSWGSGVVRTDFYVEDGYILRFYMEGTELEGDGELICIPIEIPMGIHDPDLEEFLEKTQTFAEKWARNQEAKYQRYLPDKDSELWTEASVQKQWIYGTFMNLSMQCFRDGQLVLDWSVGDSRLAEGVGPLIEAAELTPQTLEKAVEPDGKICVDVLFDGLWVSIDAYDISTQWLYDQLVAVRERVGLNALNRFQQILQQPDLEGLCLKIYYMDPVVLTYAPLSAEDVKYAADINVHVGQMICVDTQTLLEHTELLKRLDTSVVKPAEELGYVNARMCYVFETADGEEILEVVINGPKDRIYVNGVQVERDLVFLEVIEPFITEDLREAWQWDLAQWGT